MSESESINLSSRRVQRISHELKRRELEVVRVSAISPNFRSITFSGESLGDFVSASFDDHIKLILDLNCHGGQRRRAFHIRLWTWPAVVFGARRDRGKP